MAISDQPPSPAGGHGRRFMRAAQVIIVSSVMFTFISYWRTAAVVLCDLASTAYYIGGIVEQAIGPAAPFFILLVMLFSYAVRAVYIESCTLFVRGGVYRVVREALGGFLAKLAVSALMFDYLLTGPISGVSAGQYLVGLGLELLARIHQPTFLQLGLGNQANYNAIKNWGAVLIACLITLYFHRQNVRGIHESSDKAVKIMVATTIMGVIMLAWCGVTLMVRGGPVNPVVIEPDLDKKYVYDEVPVERDRLTGKKLETPKQVWAREGTGHLRHKVDEATGAKEPKEKEIVLPGTRSQEDPLGFLGYVPGLSDRLHNLSGANWLSLIGLLGLFIALGHSILAMSGEETLAQVYREVESPKLPNFKKAAFIVFVYSLMLTSLISFLAVWLIPDEIRMREYKDNLISGLAMSVVGPLSARLVLNAFVVIVGFFILAGAVNTAIIGSNGVLNRVAEDGVMPDWFLRPHPRYGTTYRVLNLIVGLQLFIIIVSRGNTFLLGEAYAFGVVWSFVFQALSMVVLRFKDRRPREFKVPLNIRIGTVEVPIGLSLILVVLLMTATMNFLTKEVATVSGLAFTAMFFVTFLISEHYHEKRRRGTRHEHLEQFNKRTTEEINLDSLDLKKPYRKLVAIRSPQNLYMLEKTLAETDPATTDLVIMTAKVTLAGDGAPVSDADLDKYDQHLMTAVVERAERAGKQVKPLIVPTNNPLYAVLRTARDLKVQELVVGASNKYTADEQLEQMAFYWINLHDGVPTPLTIRILGRDRDLHLDLGGGNRIPRISERQARSVAELRAAGVGVDRVLLTHDGSPDSSDLFEAVLTMLDPQVALGLVPLHAPPLTNGNGRMPHDLEHARQIGREVKVHGVPTGDIGAEIVRLAREGQYDLIIIGRSAESAPDHVDAEYVVRHATCRVFVATPPALPPEPEASM
jgi:amino acid transporter/nucleotide-binding universal stress UspA family protein